MFLSQPNGITISTNFNNDLTDSVSNLVSEQHSPHMDSMNGELSTMMRHQHAINCSEYPMYPLLCPGDAYAHQSAHLLPGQLKQEQQDYHQQPTTTTVKYPYRCDETLHKYPKRCTEEYHRCSEGNVVYASEQQQKFHPIVEMQNAQKYQPMPVVDLQKYPHQRYNEYAQQQCVVADEAGFYNYTPDLQKFPQRYSEDPHVRMQQPSVKYNNLQRCNEHFKYPMARNVLPNRLIGNSGFPIIGQTAIGLVVNRFNNTPGGPMPPDYAYAKNSMCINNGNDEDATMNLRYATNSISDNDDI